MNIHIRFLRQPDALRETLRQDGWELRTGPDDQFSVEHSEVQDENAARNRFHRLGLLTSPSVWIDFHPSRLGK
jgi:hypothetical protein